jgi:putative ABC transport system ATP-binding protein
MYQLDSVTKTYECRGQTVTALGNTDLSIEDGAFIAIVGTSGSGKTTLLSVLGGMLAPTSGRVMLDGQSLYDLSLKERTRLRLERIGFVFQSFNLIPWLTARENVQVPLGLAGKSCHEQEHRAIELLNRFGLSERLNHRPSELSQGQQQRVALARTLVNEPRVILADEPTGNLDPESRKLVLNYLSEFHGEGRTIVMVTHDEVAADCAQRKLWLESGTVCNVKLPTRAA